MPSGRRRWPDSARPTACSRQRSLARRGSSAPRPSRSTTTRRRSAAFGSLACSMSEAAPTVAEPRDASLADVAAELRAEERFLLTTHEGPDGDALGSLLGTHEILRQLGKDSVMFLAAKEFPLPVEYRFLPLRDVFHEPPMDVVDRVLVFLDCGNIDRMPVDFLRRDEAKVLNIDHHHDNTRFGTLHLVEYAASCTAALVIEL